MAAAKGGPIDAFYNGTLSSMRFEISRLAGASSGGIMSPLLCPQRSIHRLFDVSLLMCVLPISVSIEAVRVDFSTVHSCSYIHTFGSVITCFPKTKKSE
jgi:hypothetical protein